MALRDRDDAYRRSIVFDIVVLKDDTEEDLVGSDLHQTAIRTLCDSLWMAGPERGLPWHVSSQLVVLMGKVEGKEWRPSPDIFVHPTAGPEPLTSFDIKTYGVPPVVIEVVSPATWEYDVGSKGQVYGYVGVQEYIAFDPTADLLGESVKAWRATPDGFQPWLSSEDGRWHSAALDVSFEPHGPLLRVLDQGDALVPTTSEYARRIAALEAELGRLRAEHE